MSREVLSFKVLTTLAAQRIVSLDTSAANTVVYPPNRQTAYMGITIDTVKDTINAIPVQTEGIAKLLFNDTVAAGGLVAADTNGRGIPATLANTSASLTLAAAYIGNLVGDAVAATGTIAPVNINPGFDRISG